MDIECCYSWLLDALNEGRRDDALDHIDDLLEWQRKKGFIPHYINMKWVRDIGKQLNQQAMAANGEV